MKVQTFTEYVFQLQKASLNETEIGLNKGMNSTYNSVKGMNTSYLRRYQFKLPSNKGMNSKYN